MAAQDRIPPDAAALHAQAQAALRAGRIAEARGLLEACLTRFPDFAEARQSHAPLLLRNLNDPAAALAQIDILLAREPRNADYLAFRAAARGQTGDYGAALADYAAALEIAPAEARLWLIYGHTLKTAGHGA